MTTKFNLLHARKSTVGGIHFVEPINSFTDAVAQFGHLSDHFMGLAQVTRMSVYRQSPVLLATLDAVVARTTLNWLEVLRRIMHPAEGKCAMCAEPTYLVERMRYRAGFQRHCGQVCAANNPESSQKRSDTCMERFGSPNYLSSEEGMENTRKAMEERYGGYSWQSPELRAKYEETMRERHGGSLPSLCPNIVDKQQSYMTHTLTLGGIEFSYQGYEGVVLEHLVNELGVNPKNIVTAKSDVPQIQWVDREGKQRRYYPDIYAKVKGRWLLIEVKSTYTAGILKRGRSMFSVMRKKLLAAKEAGYDVRLVIVDKGTPFVFKDIPSINDIRDKLDQAAC